MKLNLAKACAAAAILVLAGSAQGQIGRPGGFPLQSDAPIAPPPVPGAPPAEFSIRSNLMGLLRKPDVQSEIGLDLKQKNAIAAVEEEATRALNEQMQMIQRGQNPQTGQRLSPVEARQRMGQLERQYEAAMRQFDGDLSQKVREILREVQIARLRQLDLQKRGPLALGDGRVAEELKLTTLTRQAIFRIQSEYQSEMSRVVADAMQEAVRNGDMQRGNAPDYSSRLSPVRKKLVALREQSEKRAVEALTEEEAEAWKKAQGRTFRFRPDPVARQRGR